MTREPYNHPTRPADPERRAAVSSAGVGRLAASVRKTSVRGAKRLAKDWLDRVGLDVARAGRGPRRSLRQVLAHAKQLGIAPATLIDVGVEAGTPDLYAAFPDADLLLVEPMEEWRGHLDQLARGARRVHVEIAAAGRTPGEATLYVHRVPALSLLLGARVGDAQGAQPRRVPLTAVDALIEASDFSGPYLLKVDVEGAELDVVGGATRTLESCDLLLLEVPLFQVTPGSAQFADVVCAMHERGWSVYDIYDGNVRPLDGALALVDIAFAPDDGILRANHRYATPEQAEELHRSWDY